jgi:hypothetical protein
MTGGRSAGVLAAALAIAPLSSGPGCAFAVEHPAVTTGIVGGTLGFATCKLASDNYGACVLVGGGAAAFLALVTATAIWLGGDGHSVMVEEQALPLPDEQRPRRRPAPAGRQAPTSPSPPNLSPPSPSPANPSPPNLSPTSPSPANPSPPNLSPPSPSPGEPLAVTPVRRPPPRRAHLYVVRIKTDRPG